MLQKNRSKLDSLTPEEVETITRYNNYDIELYKFAEEQFNSLLNLQPDSFFAEVELFKMTNEIFSEKFEDRVKSVSKLSKENIFEIMDEVRGRYGSETALDVSKYLISKNKNFGKG